MPSIQADRARLVLALAGALIIISVVAVSCSTSNIQQQDPDRPTIEAKGLELTRHDEAGNITVRFVSERAEYRDSNQRGTAYNIEAWFYNTDGDETLHLTAAEMDYDFSTGKLDVRGNLNGEGLRGVNFETEQAHWNESERLLTGSSELRVEQESVRFQGSSFRYNAEDGVLYVDQPRLELILPGEEE